MPEMYLLDLWEEYKPEKKADMIKILNGYLSQCSTENQPTMRAWWWYWDPTPSSLDILIYMVPSRFDSVAYMYDSTGDFAQDGSDGQTLIGPGNKPSIAEVYTRPYTATVMANLVFHEAMHMKLKKGNSMHALGGVASATVPTKVGLSKTNISAMKSALLKPVTQWSDGIAQVRARQQSGLP
ncbi:hypothetical protein [Methylobacterium brachythecii]|uniref:Uncharacterized protein n=1 Tax=Methylobacterium brachythecii TaxID=1176177 RepID=A0A7W6F9H0_9HYPH|nr:hypothetical protein [Methylobacterium brachythecii]MBB3905151.1 hypothetical protein [Methylobacterium brachythecii]GLS44342.1 hypothetical protein GCM10007884_23300 [Methylobacterium brachythecii]